MDSSSKKRIEILKQYISEDSEDIFSQYVLALEYIKQKSAPEAITLLSVIVRKQPDYLAAYYQLGKLYEINRSFGEAKMIYEAGIALAQRQKEFKTLNELRTALDLMEE